MPNRVYSQRKDSAPREENSFKVDTTGNLGKNEYGSSFPESVSFTIKSFVTLNQ